MIFNKAIYTDALLKISPGALRNHEKLGFYTLTIRLLHPLE